MGAYDTVVKVAKGVGIAVVVVPTIAITIPCALIYGIYSGISRIFRGPTGENETVRKMREQQDIGWLIEKYLGEIEEHNRQADARRLEELASEERKLRNQEKREREEMKAIERRLTDEAVVRRKYKAKSQREKREETETTRKEKREIEKKCLPEEGIAKLAELQRMAKEMAENGIPPEYLPTEEEMQQACKRVQYSPQNFHFAVAGKSGSGKSSLINAFLNLGNREDGAAQTGTKETTREISRYPDPGQLPPRQWTVWYDVPGAGTQSFPSSQYFNKLGLFFFDVIILVIADRFEEIDLEILRNCARLNIPSLIVRSKAEMHINNLVEEYDDDNNRPDDEVLHQQCRDQFIKETQETVNEELTKAGLPLQPAYIVSRKQLREIYRDSLKAFSEGPEKGFTVPFGTIHEVQLIQALMLAAQERRCTIEESKVQEKVSTWVSYGHLYHDSTVQLQATWGEATGKVVSLASAFKRDFYDRDLNTPTSRGETLFAVVRGVRGGMREILQTQQTAGNSSTAVPKVSRGKNRLQQPTYQANQWVKRILYLQAPSYASNLREELAKHNPELPTLYAIPPRMLSPKVVLLQFYHEAEIPETIHAFGKTSQLAAYEQKKSLLPHNQNPTTRTPATSATRNTKSNNRNSREEGSRH